MALEDQSDSGQLLDFFEKLYRDQTGYVYLGLKSPTQKGEIADFSQEFYTWPEQKGLILSRIHEESPTKEVYFGPALFTERSSKKVSVKGSYCVWAEFDGKVPDDAELYAKGIPSPSIRIRSSKPGHEHWYWLTTNWLSVPEIELFNRKITYTLGADVSGWDADQILRPPGTTNHKRDEQVEILYVRDERHLLNWTSDLNDAPPVLDLPIPTSIPAVEDVIAKISIPAKLFQLFKTGLPEGHRSEGLMALAFGFGELKPMLNNDELLALMLNADERWGKFKGRSDQIKRLLDIISKVRVKIPFEEPTEAELQAENDRFKAYGFTSILALDIQIDWVWEGFLHKKGYMLVTGAPGVGKSQLSLNFAGKACTGQDFIGRKIQEPRRIGFLSLEMGIEEIQYFINIQSKGYTTDELATLEENLLIFPMGEPLYLNDGHEANRLKVEELIGDHNLDGLIIDSLGSVTTDELVSEKVRGIMDWNDRLRQKMGCFTWYVHHHRKATGDNKRPNKLSDVYGSQYITARASSVVCLWEVNKALQLIPLKIRLTKRPDPIPVLRDANLHYTLDTEDGLTIVTKDSKLYLPTASDDVPVLQVQGKGLDFS